jgi:hypothetical protein
MLSEEQRDFERIDSSHKEPPLAVTQNDGE